MPPRLIICATVLLFLVLLLAALWAGFDWPPPRLILKYGFPPTGGPTGRTMAVEGVEFVELKPGYFRMGSHFLCEEGNLLGRLCGLLRLQFGLSPAHPLKHRPSRLKECPVRWVEVPLGFWIAATEVTNQTYERFAPDHIRHRWSAADESPVVDVSWRDAMRFCSWLLRSATWQCSLPTEVQWEYACRAGSLGEYYPNVDAETLGTYALTDDNRTDGADLVGRRAANPWGLFDMLGSVWELCRDDQPSGEEWYSLPKCGCIELGEAPVAPRVRRGGSGIYHLSDARCSVREYIPEDLGEYDMGFRPVLVQRPAVAD